MRDFAKIHPFFFFFLPANSCPDIPFISQAMGSYLESICSRGFFVCSKEMYDFRECFVLLLPANSPHYVITCAVKRDAQVLRCKGFFTCVLKRDAQVVFCKGFYFFGISHSPRTLLGHDHRCSIFKHYVDKL